MKTQEKMERNREMEMAANIVLFLFVFFFEMIEIFKERNVVRCQKMAQQQKGI